MLQETDFLCGEEVPVFDTSPLARASGSYLNSVSRGHLTCGNGILIVGLHTFRCQNRLVLHAPHIAPAIIWPSTLGGSTCWGVLGAPASCQRGRLAFGISMSASLPYVLAVLLRFGLLVGHVSGPMGARQGLLLYRARITSATRVSADRLPCPHSTKTPSSISVTNSWYLSSQKRSERAKTN